MLAEKQAKKERETMANVTSGKAPMAFSDKKEHESDAEVKVSETKENLPVSVKENHLPERFFAPDEMEALGGAGQENVKITDTLLPRLAILQSLSPQLKEKKVEYIPGASAGDWCDVSVGEVFKEGIEVLPCHFSTQYIQWKKNRGGFAGNLGMDASCLRDTTLDEKRRNILPNGDIIMETATWFVLIRVGYEWRRAFLPFSVTGLKISRKWMTLIRAEKLLGKSGWFTPPMFYRPWLLSVKEESNDQGEWYVASPARIPRDPADVNPKSPDEFKTIYHLMAEMGDTDNKYLLKEAQQFYIEARDNLVVGDMGTEDINDPANARNITPGSGGLTDNSKQM